MSWALKAEELKWLGFYCKPIGGDEFSCWVLVSVKRGEESLTLQDGSVVAFILFCIPRLRPRLLYKKGNKHQDLWPRAGPAIERHGDCL